MKLRRFSQQIFLVPFGKYNPKRERIDENSASYIGREGHRAFLIDALSSGGKRGSYLVTGRRGVGKTTFVDSCVDEYESSVFRRFLRGNYGRSPLDIILMMCMVLLTAFLLIVVANLLEFISPNISSNGLLIVPFLALIVIGLTPLIYSKIIISKIAINSKIPYESAATTLIIIAIVFGMWSFPPFGSPVESMSYMFLYLSIIPCLSFFFSWKRKPKKEVYIAAENLFAIISAALLTASAYIIIKKFLSFDDSTLEEKYLHAYLVFSVGLTIASSTYFIFGSLVKDQVNKTSKSSNKSVEISFLYSGTSYQILSVFLIIANISYSFNFSKGVALGLSIIAYLIIIPGSLFIKYKPKGKLFCPPIEAMIFSKAVFLCMVSLHILYPSLASFPETSLSIMSPRTSVSTADSGKNEIRKTYALGTCSFEAETEAMANSIYPCGQQKKIVNSSDERKKIYLNLFTGKSDDEIIWILLILVICSFLYILEYEWISRPFIDQRQARILNSGQRSPLQPQHSYDPIWHEETSLNNNQNLKKIQRESLNKFRRMEMTTFPYLAHSLWMPTIVTKVNLGFNSLDHRGVIHAMLFGLRGQYFRKFVKVTSPYGALSLFSVLLLSLFITHQVSKTYIDFPKIEESDINLVIKNIQYKKNPDFCEMIKNQSNDYERKFTLLLGLCSFSVDFSNKAIPILFLELINMPELCQPKTACMSEGKHIFLSLIHSNYGLPYYKNAEIIQKDSFSVRVYHLIVFLIALWLVKLLTSKFSIFPYRKTLKRIDELSESLNYKHVENRKAGSFSPAAWVRKIFSDEVDTQNSREELDPRSVELAFLSLLEDLNKRNIRLPIIDGFSISIPTPEINFVFDELDKITGILNAEKNSDSNSPNRSVADIERQRSYSLHKLLSDMKRIISSAPARFIFVGGRMLHDEWIADKGRKQPLLSSIFDAEIYLPSLMLDLPSQQYSPAFKSHRMPILSSRIEEYLYRSYQSAQDLYKETRSNRIYPFFALKSPDNTTDRFFDDEYNENNEKLDVIDWNARWSLRHTNPSKKPFLPDEDMADDFISEFVNFLTYRSAGAPKKLEEILSSFIRPVSRYSTLGIKKNELKSISNCSSVLVFKEHDIYKIQFINSIFLHLSNNFGNILLERDDKIAVNMISLFDFLIKFHGRAFSWNSLERLDELAHIHHAPDLRNMLTAFVNKSSDEYLHLLLHGLFTFRFRSEIAIEISYLSRKSEEEMAAFNFTLDESQELKNTYNALLEQSDMGNEEVVLALGELHEHDQSYEVARTYYEKAIEINDQKFSKYVGDFVDTQDVVRDKTESLLASEDSFEQLIAAVLSLSSPVSQVPFLKSILSRDKEAIKNSAHYIPWIIKRVRLMLRIGLTYEQSNDLEKAQTYYHATHLLSRSLIDLIFPPNAKRPTHSQSDEYSTPIEQDRIWLKQLLKHMNVILQPVFAEAWVSEKFESTIDISGSLIEQFLTDIRRRFPFLGEHNITASVKLKRHTEGSRPNRQSAVGDSSFSMIGSEMHNKAGDLYFFKGREPVLIRDKSNFYEIKQYIESEQEKYKVNSKNTSNIYGLEGYLLRSHYHYSVSFHEIRRFVFYRINVSGRKFNLFRGLENQNSNWNTHASNSLPSYINKSISNSLADMADSNLARTSFLTSLKEVSLGLPIYLYPYKIEQIIKVTQNIIADWLESPDTNTGSRKVLKSKNKKPPREFYFLESWINDCFGKWNLTVNELKQPYMAIVKHGQPLPNTDIITNSYLLSCAAANYLNNAGQKKAASNEYLIITSYLSRYIKWIRISLFINDSDDFFKTIGIDNVLNFPNLLTQYLRMALFVIKKYDRLLRNKFDGNSDYQVGKSISVEMITVVCDLLSSAYGIITYLPKEGKFNGDILKIQAIMHSWISISGNGIEKIINYDIYGELEIPYKRKFQPRYNTRSVMLYISSRHRYPAFGGLLNQKHIIDDSFLSDAIHYEFGQSHVKNRINEALEWLLELFDKSESFNAPMHFTPILLAETASVALVGLSHIICESNISATEKIIFRKTFERTYIKSGELISKAEQSFSQGYQYYESISDLYYLFDDYKDRKIHTHHAMQMAGADMLALYRISRKSAMKRVKSADHL